MGASAADQTGQASSSGPLAGALVVPGVQPLDGGQQQQQAPEASHSAPEAVVAREESRTRYEGQSAEQAAKTLGEAFPDFLTQRDGGPPPLAAGQSITGFTNAEVAQVDLPGGQHGVIESTVPMAIQSGPGKWDPVDLGLRDVGGAFVAANPLVPVRLPKHLAEGAQISSVGLSLTPVDAQGAPLAGSEGVADGAAAFFANTQTDADTLLKPTSRGLEASTVLRSVESPQQLYYRVGLPPGASVVQATDGSGIVQVVREGVVIATISAPHATDAAGFGAPVSMSVSGNMVVVSVAHRSGSYEYPILVDPEFWIVWSNVTRGNWEFHEWSGYTYSTTGSELWMKHTGGYSSGDYAAFSTWTKGYTKIYEMYVKDDMYPTYSDSETGYKESTFPFQSGLIEIWGSGEREETKLSGIPYATEATVCARSNCQPEYVAEGNKEAFEITTLEGGSTSFGGSVSQVSTAIGEEKGKHSEVQYNTNSPEFTFSEPPYRTANVLYGSGAWISPSNGEFEFTAKDRGLGVAETKVEYDGSGGWESFGGTNYQTNSGCIGVQCAESEHETYSYTSLTGSGGKKLPSGEDRVRVAARSPVPYTTSSEYGEGEATLKVDATPPHEIKLSGVAIKGEEIELSEVEAHLKVEATDGEGKTPSSGIQTLSLYVNGKEIARPGGRCAPGPCTASNEWAINGAELGAGTFSLAVQALDNAGNRETKYYQLTVHHASPIAMGPGSVNPESGDFALEASDVNLSGGMGSLAVTRHYDSRNTKEGEEGPLGPQWTIGLGSLAELQVLPDNSVMVVGPAGLTHFAAKEGGGFEAPEGDSNLTLEYKTEYEGKEPAYLMKDAPQGTMTVFRLPKGAKSWLPSVSKGPIATDTTTDEYKTVEVGGGKLIVEPKLELAPHPSATCEGEVMEAGCRGLKFVYDEGETTAKGEAENEWGEYKNRLKEVIAVAYNPSSKSMAKTPVAAYEYDKQGRLRAEWDPRISTPLKTIYGYDSEGHVTALTPPGQVGWAFTYGTVGGDVSSGRLIKAMRPTVSSSWNGKEPANTSLPTLSGSTVVGTKMSVYHGVWSNAPATYGYQWEDCNPGNGCVPIPEATNPEYKVGKSDVGYELVAKVTAFNDGGATSAYTARSGVVTEKGTIVEGEHRGPSEGWTVEYHVPLTGGSGLSTMTSSEVAKWGQKDDPTEAAAIFPPSKPTGWPATEYAGATVYYMDAQARTVNVAAPTGGISTREYNTEDGYVERSLSADNRETALKEANPAEASERLDTKSAYNSEGELTDTWGPQHTVKLAVGKKEANEEVLARNHVRYSYDEGAPAGEQYELVTKTVDGAETASKEEFDVRTATTSYGGQHGLGWKLRKPTSTTTDPAGLDLTHTIEYEESTGNVLESKAPEGTSELVFPPVFAGSLGSVGTGAGQFEEPAAVAFDSAGAVWVVDREDSRLEKFSASGAFIEAVGWGVRDGKGEAEVCTSSCRAGVSGAGKGQFYKPWGIAVNQSTGNVYVSDTHNNRVEEVSSSGEFVRAFASLGSGEGQLNGPIGLTVDAAGNVWVADSGNNRVEEFSAEGKYLSQLGSKGSGNGQLDEPLGVAISEGELYVVDYANSRVEEFSPSGSYIGQFGSKGSGSGQFKEPTGIAANPTTGVLVVSDAGNERLQEFSPAGRFLTEVGSYGTGKAQLHGPFGLAINATGAVYVADQSNNRLQEWTAPEAGGAHLIYSTQFGSKGSGSGQFNEPATPAVDGHGNVWVSDYANNRIQEFAADGKFVATYGSSGSGHVQFKGPLGITVNQSTGNVYVADCGNSRIEELSSSGAYVTSFGTHGSGAGQLICPDGVTLDSSGNVWVADIFNNRVEEFSSSGSYIASYGSKGSGEKQFNEPYGVTFSAGNLYVSDKGNNRVEELSGSGSYIRAFSGEGSGSGELKGPEGMSADAAGNVYVVDGYNSRVEEFSPTGAFLASFGTTGSGEGQLKGPEGVAINAAGEMYVTDYANNRVEKWASVKQAVHDTQTIYYTAGENKEHPACGKHPEWVNLPCQTQPVAQPGTPGLPELPVSTIEYNMWDQAETTIETFGSTTRTKKTTFDAAGRPETTEEKSSVDTTLPKVTDKYNKENGTIEEQSTTVGETTKKITSFYNTLGELETYTDADGNKAKYAYNIDGQVTEVTDGSEEGKGKQTYYYDETTGELTSLTDSAAGTFTAGYDAAGKMTSETYPNGMTAYYTYNAGGAATALKYKKTTHCTEEKESCVWFQDTTIPSIHGETLKQTSTLSEEPSYTYDAVGRLTQVQETPAGEGCVTRIYAYDEEANRTSLTTRTPGTEGKCATEGGAAERHIYDNANRLTDTEVSYDTFGNITNLPAADAGGPEGGSALTSSYYVDSQLYKQTQAGETHEYKLDPEDRTRETISTGKTNTTAVSHYDAPGTAVAWTSEPEGKWTRNIPGIGGELAAIDTNKTTILQLHDLQGNIVATASVSETETKLLSKYNSSEFGVPTTKTAPPKYAWLGSVGIASELPSGTVTQDGATYVPQTGRQLQTQSIELPLPVNTITPFTDAAPPGAAEEAALASALQVTQFEEARRGREAGAAPPGEIPTPSCNIETEGCAADPESGVNYYKCQVTGRFVNEAEVAGKITCGLQFQAAVIQIEIWRVENGKYVKVFLGGKPFYDAKHGELLAEPKNGCDPGKWYRGWVYGGVWLYGQFVWSSSSVISQNSKCYEQGGYYEDPIEGEPGPGSDEDGGGSE